MAIEPNLPIKDKKLEIAAIMQAKQATESAGQAVEEVKEQLVEPKQGADSANASKAETDASGSDAGGDSAAADQAAIESGRGINVNIET